MCQFVPIIITYKRLHDWDWMDDFNTRFTYGKPNEAKLIMQPLTERHSVVSDLIWPSPFSSSPFGAQPLILQELLHTFIFLSFSPF